MTRWPFVAAACALAVAAGWWAGAVTRTVERASTPEIAGVVYPQPAALDEFGLVDHHGRRFDLKRLKGWWTFALIGYTHCPDVCPTTLIELGKTQRMLSADGLNEGVRYVFVSVDPARDPPERLREYVGYFHEDILGATGSDHAIADFAAQLNLAYFVAREDEADRDYPVSHSSSVALIDPQGRYHAVFTPPLDAQRVEEGFRKILKRWETARENAGGGSDA